MTHYSLYGSPISLYTGKVRAYLDWKGLPYEEIPATAEVYRDEIVPRLGFRVVPMVVTDAGDVLQDSTDIIEILERGNGGPSITPTGGVQRLVASLLELYGDEWLVITAMHYRWHHNHDWAIKRFGELIAPTAPPDEQLARGMERAGPFAQAAVILGAATPEMQAAIERSYEALLAELDVHFKSMACVLGTRPSMADFGLYGPLYAHQYLDPASGALMRRSAPNVVRWLQRFESQTTPRSGEFLDDDAVPATLEPVLRRQMREQMPVLHDTAERLREWLPDHPGERIPRAIGRHTFEVEGTQGERIVRPYSLWMLQRARDVYKSLTVAERARADALLDRVGGESFRDFRDPPRLVRSGLTVALAA